MYAGLRTDSPRSLPFCVYPKANDVMEHGLYQLPEILPMMDFTRADMYLSTRYKTVNAAQLKETQILQMAKEIGASFAKRDSMSRHIRPPKFAPSGLEDLLYTDAFGEDIFDTWTRDNILRWFIRLFVLTDPTSPSDAIQTNTDILKQSLAIINDEGQVIGGAFNQTLMPTEGETAFREDDLFLEAVLSYLEPILNLLISQEAEALTALSTQYPAFQKAYQNGKVGHHFMIARSDHLHRDDTFSLISGTVKTYQEMDYEYLVTEATNQWTGAAFEVLGGVRVSFVPFRAVKRLCESPEAAEDMVTSSDGFIADKDSGSMFYVIRLQ